LSLVINTSETPYRSAKASTEKHPKDKNRKNIKYRPEPSDIRLIIPSIAKPNEIAIHTKN
jgi:hypothetical protein